MTSEIVKNYRSITLTSIVAKVYNGLRFNCIEPVTEKILWKNQNGFQRNRSTSSQTLTIYGILEGVRAKNLEVILLYVNFSKAFDSIHRGKMEQIFIAYGLPLKTVTAIMILYKITKVKVQSPDEDTDLLAWLLLFCKRIREYIILTSVHNLPRLRTSNVDRSNKKMALH